MKENVCGFNYYSNTVNTEEPVSLLKLVLITLHSLCMYVCVSVWVCLYGFSSVMFSTTQVLTWGLSAEVDSAWAGVIKKNPVCFSFGKASRHLREAKLTRAWHLMLQKFPALLRSFDVWECREGGERIPPHKCRLVISLSRKEPLKEMSWQFLIEFKQRRAIYYPCNSLTICWYFMWSKVQVLSRGRWCSHLKW